MGKYFIDAEDYEIGDSFAQTPWEATSSDISLEVVEDNGRKAFRIERTGGSGRHTAKLNHGLTMTGVCEVYALYRGEANNADCHIMLFANGVGGDNETGIALNPSENLGEYRITSFAPAFSTLASIVRASDIRHNSRFRSNGTNSHEAFIWDEGFAEPTDPTMVSTASRAYSDSNLTVLTALLQRPMFIYALGIGTDGDAAPSVSAAPTNLTTTDITSSSARLNWDAL